MIDGFFIKTWHLILTLIYIIIKKFCLYLQGNIDHVLELTEEKCPNLMGDNSLREEMKEGCVDKSGIPPEFVRHCVMDLAGTDIINKLK